MCESSKPHLECTKLKNSVGLKSVLYELTKAEGASEASDDCDSVFGISAELEQNGREGVPLALQLQNNNNNTESDIGKQTQSTESRTETRKRLETGYEKLLSGRYLLINAKQKLVLRTPHGYFNTFGLRGSVFSLCLSAGLHRY